MPTMNVSLSNEFIEFVEGEIATGEYGTASEVVRDALRLLRRQRAAHEEKLAILRREITIGWDEADAGQFSDKSVLDIDAELDREGQIPG
ncbi:type II toxin-antitoxin system ParD family antitoxin [Nitrospirillum iridis]|uniref:Antitoxin ParD1/3/4 n=1 Tax=Nitrospirillum iridis TaxID=765888 RepID=A0A7X0AVI5_9PROT|nr:type II toxin-antitoxin system ParD family antitoxin [Nitrospirillum iridis]MBB6250897.1 antitoxin ParD1/3/4 [Nitrospirillum iridis]